MLDSDQAKRDLNFRYFRIRIVINAVHIWIMRAFLEVPTGSNMFFIMVGH